MKREINNERRKLTRRIHKAQDAIKEAADSLSRLVNYLEIVKREQKGGFAEWLQATDLTLAEARFLINTHRHYKKTGRIDRKLVEALEIMTRPKRIRRKAPPKKKSLIGCISQLTDKLDSRELTEMDKIMLEPLKKYTDGI